MGVSMGIAALGGNHMRIEVVPVCSSYRGIGRCFTPQLFCSNRPRREMDKLLEMYFEYISNALRPASQEILDYMLCYCNRLKEHNIPCEVIVFDTQPIESVYGRKFSFLGIDITHEMAESLLENATETLISKFVNEHFLCAKASDIAQVIELCDHGGATWLPCWVYHVQ